MSIKGVFEHIERLGELRASVEGSGWYPRVPRAVVRRLFALWAYNYSATVEDEGRSVRLRCSEGHNTCVSKGDFLFAVDCARREAGDFEQRLKAARVRALTDAASFLEGTAPDETEARAEGEGLELAAVLQVAQALRELAEQTKTSDTFAWPTAGAPAEALQAMSTVFSTEGGPHGA